MAKCYVFMLTLIMNLISVNAVLGGAPVSVLETKSADFSKINTISLEQLSNFLQFINLNKSNWPPIIKSASKLFVKNSKLPTGYEKILQDYKTREDSQYIDYTLYEMREQGHHGGYYKVWIRVFKQTGVLWGEVENIPQMPIYDNFKIVKLNKTDFGEKPVTVANSLEPIGEMKGTSILKSSAAVKNCESTWTSVIDNTLKNNYLPIEEDEIARWHISKVNEVIPIVCATVDYKKISVAIMHFLINAENTDKQITGNKILWISKYDRETLRLTETVYSGVSNASIYDIVNDLHVKAIADINNDGYHDIVLTNC